MTLNCTSEVPASAPPASSRRRRFGSAATLAALLCMIGLAIVAGAPGDLDPTFGNGGVVFEPFSTFGTGTSFEIHDSVVQPDGKIVVVGYGDRVFGVHPDFLLARFETDGALDTTFGAAGTGYVYVDFGSDALDEGFGVALQADGTIVAVGATFASGRKLAVARVAADGTVLGTTVVNATGTGSDQRLFGVATDTDGSIIAVGSADVAFGQHLVILKLDANGTAIWADTRAVTNEYSALHAVTIQPDGNIVAVGLTDAGVGSITSFDWLVARYTPAGAPDTSFDLDGFVTRNFEDSNDQLYAVALQADGKIVVSGSGVITDPNGQNPHLTVGRYNADGSVDTTFGGGDGVYNRWATPGTEGIAVLASGEIVVGGSAGGSGGDGVTRLLADGTLDTSFGLNGFRFVDIQGNLSVDWGRRAIAGPGGTMVVAGDSRVTGGASGVGIARFLIEGTAPSDGDGDGVPDATDNCPANANPDQTARPARPERHHYFDHQECRPEYGSVGVGRRHHGRWADSGVLRDDGGQLRAFGQRLYDCDSVARQRRRSDGDHRGHRQSQRGGQHEADQHRDRVGQQPRQQDQEQLGQGDHHGPLAIGLGAGPSRTGARVTIAIDG